MTHQTLSAHRWRVVALAFALPLVVVVGWLFAVDKTFVATSEVRVDPVWVAALAPDGPLTGSAADARREQLRVAREELDDRLANVTEEFTYTVEPTGDDGFRFEVHAPAPEDAVGGAANVAAAFAGARNDTGAVQQAIDDTTAAIAALDAQLATPGTSTDPGLAAERTALAERLTTYQSDLTTVAAPAAAISTSPERPTEPTSPRFAAVLAGGVVAGLLLAGISWWATRPGTPVAGTGPRPAPPLGLGIGVGLAAVLLGLAGMSGLHTLWELRPEPGARTEDFYACIDRWLASVPEGTSIHPEGDPFWVIGLSAAAHPRLSVAPTAEAADERIQILLEYETTEGELPCAGYAMVRVR